MFCLTSHSCITAKNVAPGFIWLNTPQTVIQLQICRLSEVSGCTINLKAQLSSGRLSKLRAWCLLISLLSCIIPLRGFKLWKINEQQFLMAKITAQFHPRTNTPVYTHNATCHTYTYNKMKYSQKIIWCICKSCGKTCYLSCRLEQRHLGRDWQLWILLSCYGSDGIFHCLQKSNKDPQSGFDLEICTYPYQLFEKIIRGRNWLQTCLQLNKVVLLFEA